MAIFFVCALALVVNTFGVALTLFQLPGNWLIVFTMALLAWWGWDPLPEHRLVGWGVLAALLAIAVLAEIAELVLSAYGARKAGGSRRAALLAIAGSIMGAIAGSIVIPVPIVGTLVGAAAGAALGSLVGDRSLGRGWAESSTAAQGAAVGRLTATVAKTLAGLLLWLIAATAMLF